MKHLKKICICSVEELVRLLNLGLIDIDHSFAVLSLSKDLAKKESIISMMDHCACTYQDIDFDFYEEGLAKEAARAIATDIIRRTPDKRYWYFVSDDGFRGPAAMCCAFLRSLNCESEEFEVWRNTEVNISVYSLMCRSLGIVHEKGDLNLRIHTNFEVSQSQTPSDWKYSRYVHWQPAGNQQLEDANTRRSINEIHALFQAVENQLDQIISHIEEFIEEERALGYGETEDN